MRSVLAWLLLVAMVGSAGCASFRREARAARAPGFEAKGVEGYWVGRWQDEARPGHGGALECVLTPVGDHLYRAAFRSRWWKVFTSSHDTFLVLTPVRPGEYLVQGGQDLWLFGGYSVNGRVDGTRFRAVYTVAGRTGVMEMERSGQSDP
ncbi:MAG: hypothetical protein KF833_22325 [Verrucomicrobiae bacterium]|nr:hypothetical protein [Verrucomicrobiae bacterium]